MPPPLFDTESLPDRYLGVRRLELITRKAEKQAVFEATSFDCSLSELSIVYALHFVEQRRLQIEKRNELLVSEYSAQNVRDGNL